jgi:hypothetical protein
VISPCFSWENPLVQRFHDLDYEGVEDAHFLTPVRSSRGTIDVEGGPIQAPSSPWPEDRAERAWPYEEYEEEDSFFMNWDWNCDWELKKKCRSFLKSICPRMFKVSNIFVRRKIAFATRGNLY